MNTHEEAHRRTNARRRYITGGSLPFRAPLRRCQLRFKHGRTQVPTGERLSRDEQECPTRHLGNAVGDAGVFAVEDTRCGDCHADHDKDDQDSICNRFQVECRGSDAPPIPARLGWVSSITSSRGTPATRPSGLWEESRS